MKLEALEKGTFNPFRWERMSKILITGGGGFIGFNIAQKLSESPKNEIHLVDNFFKEPRDGEFDHFIRQNPNCRLIEGDLSDPTFYSQLDDNYNQIYHLAAIVGVKYADENPDLVLRVNTLSTMHLLEWIRKKRETMAEDLSILFASSCENYASTVSIFSYQIPTPEIVPLCIADPRIPRWSYASTKILGEVAFLQYGRVYDAGAKIVRYHNVYGPRMGTSHVIPEFILRVLRKKDPFEMFGGDQYRSFCYVSDAAEMTIRVMNHSGQNDIFNVGSDEFEIRIQDIAQRIFDISGFYPSTVEKNAPLGSVERRAPDMTLMKSLELFYHQCSLEDGLRMTYEWYAKMFEEKSKNRPIYGNS